MTLTQQFDDSLNVDAENVEQQKINDDFNESVDENLKITIEEIIEFAIVSFLNSNSILFRFSRRSHVVVFDFLNLKLNFLARFSSTFRRRVFFNFVHKFSSTEFSFEVVVSRRCAFSRLFSTQTVLKSIFELNFRFFIFFSIFVVSNDTQYVKMRNERSKNDFLND